MSDTNRPLRKLADVERLTADIVAQAQTLRSGKCDPDPEHVAAGMVQMSRELNAAVQEIHNAFLGVPQPKLAP